MVIPDVNVLVHAARQDSAQHQASLAWLTDRLTHPGDDVIVPDLIWVGFARICTSARIFVEPSSVGEVTAFMVAVTAQPAYRAVPGLTFGIESLFTLMAASDARGDLVTDAYIAAIALQLGATVCSYDRDFRRFDDLTLVTPAPM